MMPAVAFPTKKEPAMRTRHDGLDIPFTTIKWEQANEVS
jgi:hypothetical protein